MIVEIPLSRGKFALIDEQDRELISGFRWYARPSLQTNENWYVQTSVSRKTIYMHRLILAAPKGVFVDHANGNGLDNRRDNIRLCSWPLNCANRRVGYAPTSGYRGVYQTKAGRYRARIWFNGKSKQLGCYPYPEEAARAYDNEALALFGEFAVLNFPRKAA